MDWFDVIAFLRLVLSHLLISFERLLGLDTAHLLLWWEVAPSEHNVARAIVMNDLLDDLAALSLILTLWRWLVHGLDWQGDWLGLGVELVLLIYLLWIEILLVVVAYCIVTTFASHLDVGGLDASSLLNIFCHGAAIALTWWNQLLLGSWVIDWLESLGFSCF